MNRLKANKSDKIIQELSLECEPNATMLSVKQFLFCLFIYASVPVFIFISPLLGAGLILLWIIAFADCKPWVKITLAIFCSPALFLWLSAAALYFGISLVRVY